MNDDLVQTITDLTTMSVKKQIICQCAADIYKIVQDVDRSVAIAKEIVDKVYNETV